jgi:conjugative transfer signal peptidase TraF
MKTAHSLLALSYTALLSGWMMGVRIVTTPSVPLGLYRTHHARAGELTRGAFVCIRALSDDAPSQLREVVREHGHPSTWIKVVTGLPGDIVSRSLTPAQVEINGVGLRDSAVLATDSKGRGLSTPTYPVVIPPNQVWLSSLHPLGYDSRYFGTVDMRALSCVAEPLWTL